MSDDDRYHSQLHAAPNSDTESDEPDEEEEPIDVFTRTLEERRNAGDEPVACMTAAFKAAGVDLDEDDALRACIDDYDFTVEDLAAYLMSVGKRDTKEIATTLDNFMTPTAEEWVASLLPTVEGLPARERMERIMDAVSRREIDVGGETIDFVGPFLNDGCTPEEVVKTLFDKTDAGFSELIDALPSEPTPEQLGTLLKACDIDVREEYENLRAYIEFEDAAAIVRASGGDAALALSCEASYSDLDSENLIDVLGSLVKAGYPSEDALKAILDSGDSPYSAADVIEASFDPSFEGFDLYAYLAEVEPDPEDLYNDLSEKDIDIKDRVRILHRLLFPEQYPQPAEDAIQQSPSSSSSEPRVTAAGAEVPAPTAEEAAAPSSDAPASDPDDWAAGV